MRQPIFSVLLLITVALLAGAFAHPGQHAHGNARPASQPQSPPSEPPPTESTRVLVDSHDTAALEALRAHGAVLLVDYGAFHLWSLPASQATMLHSLASVAPRDDFDTIYMRGTAIRTSGKMPAVAASLQQTRTSAPQFWMMQFIGPVKDAWLHAVEEAGLERVAYLPTNAYVVWGDGAALDALDALASRAAFIQWSGPYHPAYRLAPTLHPDARTRESENNEHETNNEQNEGEELVDVTVQIYATNQLSQSLARLTALGGKIRQQPTRVRNMVNTSLQLPASQLETVAAWPDVFNVEPWGAPELHDEVQGQIVAGNVISQGGLVVPEGPGYLEWLLSQGFSTSPASYPIVDVVDSGFDTGDAENVQHPDLYISGNPAAADRVAYVANCTREASGNDTSGHGTINVGIVGSYNNETGWPYEDDQGYRIGLGISPFGQVASTKVFDLHGYFDASECGSGTDEDIVANSFAAGAALTSNSWGSRAYGEYDTAAQSYDSLTRDAVADMDGNQEMLHIFSAGNRGPDKTSIGSPATAKNVVSVGATENVRDDDVLDGCSIDESNSADDIIFFSSRGPTKDGRAKPDLVAPGTHVQGPASQDPSFIGDGVCAMRSSRYYPTGQTLYTWSSGTSHAAPAVAGAASLIYEYYGRVLLPGDEPSPAMLKALLLNSTRYLGGEDANDTLPGTAQGWGGVNLGMMFDGTPRLLIDQNIVFSATGEIYQFNSVTADPTKPLRVSLVWTDAPGTTTGNAYVNDLDLEVTTGGATYRGNVFSGSSSTTGGDFDTYNNVEHVMLPAGVADTFTVRVIARNIVGDGLPGNDDETDQDFALVVYNDSRGVDAANKLEGIITDAASGEPVAGATIELTAESSEHSYTFRGSSQADGSYVVVLPEGSFTLTVSAYGYKTWERANVAIEQKITTLNIRLEPVARVTLRGRVYDTATGQPIYAQIDALAGNHTLTAFTTPEDGTYSLLLVPGVFHDITVRGIGRGDFDLCGGAETCVPLVEPYLSVTRIVVPGPGGITSDFGLKVNSQACAVPGYTRSYVYFADFEADNGGFLTSWTSSWEWGVPTSGPAQSHSGSKVWATNLTGNYEGGSSHFLTSPPIDLSSYEGRAIILSWWQWFETSSGDPVIVYISSDGGQTWKRVYRDHGEGLAWSRQHVVLTDDYAVPDFRVRFALYANGYHTRAGYYVDDVGIEANPLTIIYAEDFEATDGDYAAETKKKEASNNSWEWGAPTSGPARSHSGSKVWATNLGGNYLNREESVIISPAIDLSSYADSGITLSWWQWVDVEKRHDQARVEVSKDNGTTWKRVALSYQTDGWEWRSINLDSSYAVPTFRVRFGLSSDESYAQDGFYVDDVQVGVRDYRCFPREGGLVVGRITDLASGKGINGVQVQSSSDGASDEPVHRGATTSFEVPDDPAMGDGYYVLFLPTGRHHLTALGEGSYQPVTRTVQVNPHAATRQDFTISSAWLESRSQPLSVTLHTGEQISLPLLLRNTTPRVITFSVKEHDNGYGPAAIPPGSLSPATHSMPQPAPPGQQQRPEQGGWRSTLELPDDFAAASSVVATTYQPARSAFIRDIAIEVLLLGSEAPSELQAMLQAYPDIETVKWFDASLATPTFHTLLAYDAVLVVTEQSFADPVGLGDVLADYLDAGGNVVQTVPTFYAREGGGWDIQGRFLAEGYSPFVGSGNDTTLARLGTFNAEHPIMRGVKQASDSLRQRVELSAGAQLVASWEDEEECVATKGSVVALNTFVAPDNRWEGDIDLIIHNSLIWLQGFSEVAWLSVAPVSSTVALSQTVALSVSINAQSARPGDHEAYVVAFNEQQQEIASIPVQMHVRPSGKWGKLRGIVTTRGYCHDNPAPLEGAEVTIEGSGGNTWTTTTDISGTYQIWLEEASSPVRVTIAAPDYGTHTTSVNVAAEEETTHKAELKWLQPCVEADVERVEVTLKAGERKTETFHLANTGGVPAEVTIKISSSNKNDLLSWLEVAPMQVTIEPGQKESVAVTFDPGLPLTPITSTLDLQRKHNVSLEISSNDPVVPMQSLPMKMTIIGTPENVRLVEIGLIEIARVSDIVVQNNTAYIGTSRGLAIYDVSNPDQPQEIALLDTSYTNIYDVEVVGSHVYIILENGSMGVVDVSNPFSPTVQGSYYEGDFYKLAAVDNLVYAVTRKGTLQVFDVSTPGTFTPLGTLELAGEGKGIQVMGERAYVAVNDEGMQIIDISNPASPMVVGGHGTPSYARSVAVAGSTLFLADYDSGVYILDISTPANPAPIANHDTPGTAWDIEIVDTLALIADGSAGVHIVDVSIPAMPVLLESYDTPGSALKTEVVGDLLFVADWDEGVCILKMQPANQLSFLYLPIVQR